MNADRLAASNRLLAQLRADLVLAVARLTSSGVRFLIDSPNGGLVSRELGAAFVTEHYRLERAHTSSLRCADHKGLMVRCFTHEHPVAEIDLDCARGLPHATLRLFAAGDGPYGDDGFDRILAHWMTHCFGKTAP